MSAPTSPPLARHVSGFTLIEMLVCLLVLGVVFVPLAMHSTWATGTAPPASIKTRPLAPRSFPGGLYACSKLSPTCPPRIRLHPD
ncbi:prepilin-type N-terminal cleavage/methylation domain-containing protein [Deinococcus ruber]|uniref:prepilin-type N-terminal cleavage/methylation domain-containing protein n=1 Tax=Deinococcus ruber TaxID=1848197 RepID=UPI001666D6C8